MSDRTTKIFEEWYEKWNHEREVRFRNFGKCTYRGVEAKFNLARAKKNYEEELRYHNLNPSNRSRAIQLININIWPSKTSRRNPPE